MRAIYDFNPSSFEEMALEEGQVSLDYDFNSLGKSTKCSNSLK